MPFFRHVLTTLRIITKPSVVVPNLTVKSIANVNFIKLKEAGYEGVVIDRDNCLTKPRQDELVPSLQDAWEECRKAFGTERVLIVSNSAGTSKDASFLQAEALTRNLGVPVLLHDAPKPWVVKPILHYFNSLPRTISLSSEKSADAPSSSVKPAPPKLVVIGDRLSTDIVLANRLQGAFGIWTTKVWEEESAGVRLARLVEDAVLAAVVRWRAWRRKRRGLPAEEDTTKEFVKEEPVVQEPVKVSWWGRLVSIAGSLLPSTN